MKTNNSVISSAKTSFMTAKTIPFLRNEFKFIKNNIYNYDRYIIASFVVIFRINTTSNISKLLYVSRAVRWVKFETILKYHLKYISFSLCFIPYPSSVCVQASYAKYHIQIMLLFVYTTTCNSFVIFTCRYFKLSWNTTALSQSKYRNFSRSSIIIEIS